MGTVPTKYVDKIQFYENHLAKFTTNAVAIGTTSADVTDLTTKTEAARAAFTAQQLAIDAAKDATLAMHDAVRAMGVKGAAIIKQVRAKAESTGNVNVYVLAGLPAPAVPTTPANPGTPNDFKLQLKNNGALEFTWKAANPANASGTMYQVYRSLDDGPSVQVGATGSRKFLDAAIPAGTAKVTYQIQGIRSNAAGDWAEFNVNFGTTPGGVTTASLGTQQTKLAA